MRLVQLTPEEWKNVASYVDTLCLPVTSIKIENKEIMVKSSRMVEDFAEDLERKLGGRLLLLPSITYMGGNVEVFNSYLSEIITEMEQSGFYYIVFIIDGALKEHVKEMRKTEFMKVISCFTELPEDPTQTEIDEVRESLYQKVLAIWSKT